MSGRLAEAEWIWKDGEFVRWEEARIHLLSLAVQFGSSVFEGIRCYETSRGPAIFRLDAHLRRLEHSCRVYRMELPRDRAALDAACRETIRRNGLRAAYLRPMVLRGYGAAGLDPAESPIETWIPAWPWGEYLGKGALESGVDVCVSSWQRPRPNTFPVGAKAAGHYTNAQLVKMEAIENGYAEAIVTSPDGLVSEGSGQNLFLVRDGSVVTPSRNGTALYGITRDAVLTLASDLGIDVRERGVAREELYGADELFFTGTATEVTPIRSVDRIPVGNGRPGPVTGRIQERFDAVVRGEVPEREDWLAFVEEPE